MALAVRRKTLCWRTGAASFCAAALTLLPVCAAGQQNRAASGDSGATTSTDAGQPASAADVHALSDTVSALQAEIQALKAQIDDLRTAQNRSDQEVQFLNEQLLRAEQEKPETPSVTASAAVASASGALAPSARASQNYGPAPPSDLAATPMNSNGAASADQTLSLQDRVSQLEEDDELLNSKL